MIYFWRNDHARRQDRERDTVRDQKMAAGRLVVETAISSTAEAANRLVTWLRKEFIADVQPNELRAITNNMNEIMDRAKEHAD